MKKLLLVRLGAAVLLCSPAGRAADWTALRPEGYVSDFARVIDRDSRNRLESFCAEVERATGARLTLVTVPSLLGEPVDDVASALARAWDAGHKSAHNGVLLLLSTGDRRTRLEVGPALGGTLPGDLPDQVLRGMRSALRRQQYGDAFLSAADILGRTLARARHVTLAARVPLRVRSTVWDWLPWPLLAGGVLILIWLMRAGHPRGYGGWVGGGLLPGLFLGRALRRSTWGSRGSGGFGGYDSADSFGGFGGGDFGAGGASPDW